MPSDDQSAASKISLVVTPIAVEHDAPLTCALIIEISIPGFSHEALKPSSYSTVRYRGMLSYAQQEQQSISKLA